MKAYGYIKSGLISSIFLLTVNGCVQLREPLSVTGGAPVRYQCELNMPVTVRYYYLSDKSLDFAKLTLSNGQEYTLPKTVSVLGDRYTDNRELSWSSNGKNRFIEKLDDNGKWRVLYNNCQQL